MTKKFTSRHAAPRDMHWPNDAFVVQPRAAGHRRSTSPRHGADSVDADARIAGPARAPVGERKRRAKAEGWHHAEPKPSSHRLAAATALSALLAISAGLYPLSNNSRLLDLYPPKYGSADPPASGYFDVIDVPQVILLDLKRVLPDLLDSFEQALPASTDDLPEAAESLRSLQQLASVAQTTPELLGAAVAGGGGGFTGRSSRNVPARLLLTVGTLLESVTPRLADLPLADLGASQTAALNRLIHFLAVKFPTLSVHEVVAVRESPPVEVKAPEINAVDVPVAPALQAASVADQAPVLSVETVAPAVVAYPPVVPPAPEVAEEPPVTPRDVSLLKPHLTTPVTELATNSLTGSRSLGVKKTLSTVASGAGPVSAVSGTVGSVTGSVSKTLGSVTRSLGGSSSESDAGSSSGG